MFEPHDPNRSKFLPKRIILVRHGESEGNRDNSTYTTIPDHQITLTPQGITQARHAGTQIQRVVSNDKDNWRVYFYVSPYVRTRSSLREIAKAFPRKSVIGVREECRIREQDFGNFQVTERMKDIKESRQKFGRFFYRFPEGESAADVYDRVSSKFFPIFIGVVILEIIFMWFMLLGLLVRSLEPLIKLRRIPFGLFALMCTV